MNDNKERLMEISKILAKYDIVHGVNPEKLRLIIEELGPTFVKLGQIMSMRTDMLPESYCEELTKLRADVRPMTKEEIEKSIENIIEIMDMESFIDNRIENLSTGQTQRTSIARCLIHNPSIYIFDEPTLGLDVISSKSIIDFMKREKYEGKTVLYSTHYMEEAEILCDKIYMMHKGEFIAEGSCEELKSRYNTNSLRDIFINLASERGDLNED